MVSRKAGFKLIIQGIDGVPVYKLNILDEKYHKIALMIPVLNEGSRIITQLSALRNLELNVDLIIADGGSEDGLEEKIENGDYKVRAVLTKKDIGGLSAQLRMGFHFCLTQGYESVITMDGNNKDDPIGVHEIINALESGCDFVQGSRFVSGGKAINTPIARYLAIRLLHAPITSLAAKFWYTDTTNGFRGHSARLIQNPQIQVFRKIFSSYELLAYIPIRSKQVGLKVVEVPVTRSYPLGEKIPTKILGIKAQLSLLQILFACALGKFDPNSKEINQIL